jgi:hypothetical protein
MSHNGARTGTTLHGRYGLQRLIAEGAVGSVYLGERRGLSRAVAVKFLRAELAGDPRLSRTFETATRQLGRLCHPNCVSVFDYGFDRAPYVVMDFVAGPSLREVLRQGPLPPQRAISITRQLLAALAHAHAKGLVHGAPRPENILLEAGLAGPEDHVRLIDIGLSKLLEETAQITDEMIIGTPCYLAPEQLQAGIIDERTDVFTCGVVLLEMLTGRNPFDCESLGQQPAAQELDISDPALTPDLAPILRRALARDPGERFASALQMKQALDALSAPVASPRLWLAQAGAALRAGLPLVRAGLGDLRTRLQSLLPPLRLGLRALHARGGQGVDLVLAGGRALGRGWQAQRSWPQARRVGALGLAAFLLAFSVVFALKLLGASPVVELAPAVAIERPPAPATPEAPPVEAAPAPRAMSQIDRALSLARDAFEHGRYAEGIDYFRFAARRDRQVRGNAVLVDHVIDALASKRMAPRADALLRELGADARPHVQNAARTHDDARVRERARALLASRRPLRAR